MPTTIPDVAVDANGLFSSLTTGIDLNLGVIPPLVLDMDFAVVEDTTLPVVQALTLDDLTTKVVGGAGVFDGLMASVNAHMAEQHSKNRITGADYAKVYLGALQAVMQFGVQFLLGKDRARLENLQVLETIKLTQVQRVRAHADVQLARAQIQQALYASKELELRSKIALNEFASTKMNLVLGFNSILEMEGRQKLTNEQYETQRAQTRDTLSDGATVTGVVGNEIALGNTKIDIALEELDTTRANTKETLRDGLSPVQGMIAVEKDIKQATVLEIGKRVQLVGEQFEGARAQVRNTLSTGEAVAGLIGNEISLSATKVEVALEELDTTRANTKETLRDGISPILGLVALEKEFKAAGILEMDNKVKLTNEQYETQRGQTRNTLSTGQTIAGVIGNEIALTTTKIEVALEELDTTRANTKETLRDGLTPVAGMVAIEKNLKEANILQVTNQADLLKEQFEVARAQTKDTLSDGSAIAGLVLLEKQTRQSAMLLAGEQYEIARAQIRDSLSTGGLFAGLVAVEKLNKAAQNALLNEQVDAQRANTKDTLVGGAAITGLAAKEKLLKDAQYKLVLEQFETQRGQTRGTLSTGELVLGLVGAQTGLYQQQVVSYKRDAESKGVKMLLDTWTARKTIDEAVAVPVAIDTAALQTIVTNFRTNLEL